MVIILKKRREDRILSYTCTDFLISMLLRIESKERLSKGEIIKFHLYFSSSYNEDKFMELTHALRPNEASILKMLISFQRIKERNIFLF